MSTADNERRVRWGYEDDTPICATCRNYRKARVTPKRLDPAFCAAGKFTVKPGGSCDRWKDRKTGQGLA